MKLFIDLFAGLLGASQAFVDSDDWEVLAIDDNQLCINAVDSLRGRSGLEYFRMDVMDPYTLNFIQGYIARGNYSQLVIWASPPCTEFSDAQLNRPKHPSMELVERTIEIIDSIQPDVWYIENVKGAIREFKPILGMPRQSLFSFFLWGNFPYVGMPQIEFKKDDAWSTNPLRANIRAKLPLVVSQSILDSLENQSRLWDF